MVKIERVTSATGVERTIDELANLYYDKLESHDLKPNIKQLIKEIEHGAKKTNNPNYRFYEKIKEIGLKKILTEKPAFLENEVITKIEGLINNGEIDWNLCTSKSNSKIKDKKFKDEIESVFGYKLFRTTNNTVATWLAKELNIRTCPYCNSQFTLVADLAIEKDGKKERVLYQLDHFFPKSRYPYLSLSFYNLIPSCAACNLGKTNKNTSLLKNLHPYVNDFDKEFKFSTTLKSVKDFICDNKEVELKKIQSNNKKVQTYLEMFNIEGVYKNHIDTVQDLYKKAHIYNKSRKKELLSLMKGADKNSDKLFTKDELNRFITGNYVKKEDLHKRPLAKLTKDIAEELKMFD